VTGEMVKNFAAGGAAICVLARAIAARLEVVDVGVLNPLPELPIVQAKVAAGTANLAVEAAMTRQQCAAAGSGPRGGPPCRTTGCQPADCR
jgi:nicotinate-nucleotide--dimethylbenzimidazole phosphoribosyltransferase